MDFFHQGGKFNKAHHEELVNYQNGLRNTLDDYRKDKCDDPNDQGHKTFRLFERVEYFADDYTIPQWDVLKNTSSATFAGLLAFLLFIFAFPITM
jgi:hypothetical protein